MCKFSNSTHLWAALESQTQSGWLSRLSSIWRHNPENIKKYTDVTLVRQLLYFGLISKLSWPLPTLPAVDLLPINKFEYVAGFTGTWWVTLQRHVCCTTNCPSKANLVRSVLNQFSYKRVYSTSWHVDVLVPVKSLLCISGENIHTYVCNMQKEARQQICIALCFLYILCRSSLFQVFGGSHSHRKSKSKLITNQIDL